MPLKAPMTCPISGCIHECTVAEMAEHLKEIHVADQKVTPPLLVGPFAVGPAGRSRPAEPLSSAHSISALIG